MAYSIDRPRSLQCLESRRAAWSGRRRHVPTVLAPALPALILLAITTAGMVDPPQAGLMTQLHLTRTAVAATPSHLGSITWSVTAR